VAVDRDAPVRLGVVGAGLIAQVAQLPALRELGDRFVVPALAEPSRRVRETVARRHGIPAAYAGHAELLEREALDALLVCSPNGSHASVVRDALDAGLHVLVEKPLCLDPAEAAALVRHARERGRVVQVGYMKRFDPAYERLLAQRPPAEALRLAASATVDPGIGELLAPPGLAVSDDVPAAARRALADTTAAQVASALGDEDPRHVAPFSDACLGALVHDVNLLLGAYPGPWRPADGAIAADGTLVYGAWRSDGGARWTAAWLRIPAAAEFTEELALYAGGAALRLRFPAPYLGSAPAELRMAGAPETRWRVAANPYRRALEHFHACLTAGAQCRSPAEDGARDVALLTELYRAAV
jgi:predicted dehydrogenase